MALEAWIDAVVGTIDTEARTAIVLDPRSALQRHFGLRLQAVETLSESRADGGFCDGTSYLDDGVVLFAPTPNSRRENFTLAHELGHWLVEEDQRLFDWIADQPNAHIVLETVCDRIAQRLLLPDDLIDSIVGSDVVRARHVTELYDSSTASLPACAIGIARRLPGIGAVLIASPWDGSVMHASIRPDHDDGWPKIYPWRGQLIPDTHPLSRLQPGGTLTRRISWRSSWGSQTEFFADAVATDTRIVAVFADTDVWKVEPGRVLEPRDYDQRPSGIVTCCGQTQSRRGYPCPTCGQQYCGVCGRCRCERAAASEQPCHGCFLLRQPHLLVNNLCEDCR